MTKVLNIINPQELSVIAQHVAAGYVVIVLDPRGDQGMYEAARACASDLLDQDIVYFHPAFPERCCRIDALASFSRTMDSNSDPFTAFSLMAVNKLAEALIFVHARPSLVLLRRLLENGMTGLLIKVLETHFEAVRPSRDPCGRELPNGWESEARAFINSARNKGEEGKASALIQYYRDHIVGEHPNATVEGLISIFEHDATHFGHMLASFMPVLFMLTSGPMAELLSPDYEDPDDPRPITSFKKITRDPGVTYLALDSLSDSTLASCIGALLLSEINAVAGDSSNLLDGERPKIAVFVCNDPQFASAITADHVGPMEPLWQKVNAK